jgi:hypothetical protein
VVLNDKDRRAHGKTLTHASSAACAGDPPHQGLRLFGQVRALAWSPIRRPPWSGWVSTPSLQGGPDEQRCEELQLGPKRQGRRGDDILEARTPDGNRAVQEALLKVLDGGGSTVSAENGEVKLKLGPVLAELGEGSGVGEALISKLPPEAGEITVLKSDELSLAQEVANLLRKAPIALTLAALLCFALAVYLAPRRREALRSVGLAFAIAGLLSLTLRGFAGTYVVGGLSRTTSVEPAVEAVWSIGTSMLVTIATSAIVFGLLVVRAAVLAGPTKVAVAIRRYLAPYARRSPAGIWGAAVLIFLALIAWAPVAAFHKPLGFLIFALLFAAGTELYRRQLLEESTE